MATNRNAPKLTRAMWRMLPELSSFSHSLRPSPFGEQRMVTCVLRHLLCLHTRAALALGVREVLPTKLSSTKNVRDRLPSLADPQETGTPCASEVGVLEAGTDRPLPLLFWPGNSLRLGRQTPSELGAAALQRDAQCCCSSGTSGGIPAVRCVCADTSHPPPPRQVTLRSPLTANPAGLGHLTCKDIPSAPTPFTDRRPVLAAWSWGCGLLLWPQRGWVPPVLLMPHRGESTVPGMGCKKGSRAALESTPDSFLPCVHAGPEHPPHDHRARPARILTRLPSEGMLFPVGSGPVSCVQALKVTWSEYRKRAPGRPPPPRHPGLRDGGLPCRCVPPVHSPSPCTHEAF